MHQLFMPLFTSPSYTTFSVCLCWRCIRKQSYM